MLLYNGYKQRQPNPCKHNINNKHTACDKIPNVPTIKINVQKINVPMTIENKKFSFCRNNFRIIYPKIYMLFIYKQAEMNATILEIHKSLYDFPAPIVKNIIQDMRMHRVVNIVFFINHLIF